MRLAAAFAALDTTNKYGLVDNANKLGVVDVYKKIAEILTNKATKQQRDAKSGKGDSSQGKQEETQDVDDKAEEETKV